MTLYQIDSRLNELIANAVDDETGEIVIDQNELDALQMEREAKIENIALYIKNLISEAAAIKAEEETLKARRESAEKKAKNLTGLLDMALDGEAFKTARVEVKYRKTKTVEVNDGFTEWAQKNAADLIRVKTSVEPDKMAIKAALSTGREVMYAGIVEGRKASLK